MTGPFWDDLSEEERQRHRQRVDRELRAIGGRSYPVEALFGPPWERVTVLGPARRFPPYDDPSYGPQSHRGDFQLMATRPGGDRFILMAQSLRDPATGRPWLTRAPRPRDDHSPLLKAMGVQQNPDTGGFKRDFKAGALKFLEDGPLLVAERPGDVWVEVIPEPDNEVELSMLTAQGPKGTGAASRALRWLLDLADRHGLAVTLRVSDYGPATPPELDPADLIAWYGRHGFEVAKREGHDIRMVRRRQNPTEWAHPAVEAFWKQLMAEVPHEDWARGVDLLDEDVTANLEQTQWGKPEVWIQMIESKAKGKGKASRVMRWLTSLADRHGVTLLLVPDSQSEDGLPTEALMAWYGRLGFVPEEGNRFGGGTGVIVRRPRTGNPLRLSGRMGRQGNPGPIPAGILREIHEASAHAGSSTVGVRRDDDAYAVGDVLPPSRRWDDGGPTEEDLDGTSAVEVRKAPLLSQYLGRYIYLLAGDYHTYGEDEGEVILRPARVVGVWDLGRQGNPLRLSGRMREVPLDEDLREEFHDLIRIHAYPPTPGMLAFMRDYDAGTSPMHQGSGWRMALHEDQVLLEVDMDPNRGAIHISEIKAIDKRQGAGTRALRFLTTLADRHQVPLTLSAAPLGAGAMKQGALVRWYRKHGFQRKGRHGWFMIRKPRR